MRTRDAVCAHGNFLPMRYTPCIHPSHGGTLGVITDGNPRGTLWNLVSSVTFAGEMGINVYRESRPLRFSLTYYPGSPLPPPCSSSSLRKDV
eukprot:scaffold79415_cov27-Tisochrysis_lutea.AAC.1